MISVCKIWNDFKGRENTWQGGHIRPSSFVSWLHEIQIEILNELIKALGNNQVVTDNLRHLIKSVQVPIGVQPRNGLIGYPKDYRRFVGLRFFSKKNDGVGVLCKDIDLMCGAEAVCIDDCKELTEEQKSELQNSEEMVERTIEVVQNQFWGSVSVDEIAGPSIINPYGTQYEKGFKVLPKGIGYAVLDYIAIPSRPKFDFTRDAQNNIICNEDKCEHLLWGEEMLPEILARLKTRYSAFTRYGEGYSQGRVETQDTKS